MFPHDFYLRYKKLEPAAVAPGGGLVKLTDIACVRYLTNSDKTLVNPDDKSKGSMPTSGSPVDKVMKAVGGIQSLATQYTEKARGGADMKNKSAAASFRVDVRAFGRVVYGKGTPDDMEHVLSAGLLCGALSPGPPSGGGLLGPILQHAATVAAAASPVPATISAGEFARQQFGIDCTGFVSAYFLTKGLLPANTVVQDHRCATYYDAAKSWGTGKGQKATQGIGFVWDPMLIMRGDVLVWMEEGGTETRKPIGHTALIGGVPAVAPTENPLCSEAPPGQKPPEHAECVVTTLTCYESNGSEGEDPRETTRLLMGNPRGPDGHRYWLMNNSEKVLVIRPWM